MKYIDNDDLQGLFDFFHSAFPGSWGRNYHASVAEAWMLVLKDLTKDDIQAGINAVMNKGSDFPPSLPAFKKMCVGSAPSAQDLVNQAISKSTPLGIAASIYITSFDLQHRDNDYLVKRAQCFLTEHSKRLAETGYTNYERIIMSKYNVEAPNPNLKLLS